MHVEVKQNRIIHRLGIYLIGSGVFVGATMIWLLYFSPLSGKLPLILNPVEIVAVFYGYRLLVQPRVQTAKEAAKSLGFFGMMFVWLGIQSYIDPQELLKQGFPVETSLFHIGFGFALLLTCLDCLLSGLFALSSEPEEEEKPVPTPLWLKLALALYLIAEINGFTL